MGRVERYNSFTIAPKSLGHGQPTLIVHLSGEGFSAGPQLQALDRSGPRWVKVIPAGPQLQALVRCGPHGRKQQHLNQSDPHRTTTASSRSQWSPPDPASNRWLKVIPAGPPLQVLDRSGPRRTRLEPLASRSSLSLSFSWHWRGLVPQLRTAGAGRKVVKGAAATGEGGQRPSSGLFWVNRQTSTKAPTPDQSVPRRISPQRISEIFRRYTR